MTDPDSLLDVLNDEQRLAATAATGPVVIHAGAGTGKTRVIVHRVAYAVATGTVDPGHILLVTFTDKAANEMRQRVAALGVPRVAVMTFHAAARRQLQHFWPQVYGTAMPGTLADPWPLVAPMVRSLPGGFKFTPTKDVIDTIGWLRSQQLSIDAAEAAAKRTNRTLPIPIDLLADLINRYESEKQQRNVIDFNDMIELTTGLLRDNVDVHDKIQQRYRWFSVDEFQDTSQAQNDLLNQWLGDRHDICVVGDSDQTIYSFTGASSSFLTDFPSNHPGSTVLKLAQNYRSSPQIVGLANRLLAAPGSSNDKLRATLPDGPEPTISEHPTDVAEIDAIVTRIRDLLTSDTPGNQIAVLTRLNADLAPFEAALTRARIPHQTRGRRFFERREVQQANRLLRSLPADASGEELLEAIENLMGQHLGYSADDEPRHGQARERQVALTTWLQMVAELANAPQEKTTTPAPDDGGRQVPMSKAQVEPLDAEPAPIVDPLTPPTPLQISERLATLANAEAADGPAGIELVTLHRSKGLEWQVVFLPGVEEGRIPAAQAKTAEAISEEKRLLYVGITRAKQRLFISWAKTRSTAHGSTRKGRSRFLAAIQPKSPPRPPRPARAAAASTRKASGRIRKPTADKTPDSPGLSRLKEWRKKRAEEDGVPPYVVFHDRTLQAILDAGPTCPDDLLAISGIGPAKLERYGDQVLSVLRDEQLPNSPNSD